MPTFTLLILICSMALDHAACQPDTAEAVSEGPRVTEMECAFVGQAQLAPTAIAPRPGEEYLKIVCQRETPERAAAATAN